MLARVLVKKCNSSYTITRSRNYVGTRAVDQHKLLKHKQTRPATVLVRVLVKKRKHQKGKHVWQKRKDKKM
jgi:hypothetical protein